MLFRSEIGEICEKIDTTSYLIGDLNLDSSKEVDVKKLSSLCGEERMQHLCQITTIGKYPSQLDHIIVRKSIKHLVISDCWYNFISDHKFLTLRITNYANDKPLLEQQEQPEKVLEVNHSKEDIFVKPKLVTARKKIKEEKKWKDSEYEKTSEPYLSSLIGERWLTNFVIDDYLSLIQNCHEDTFIFSSHFTESFFSLNRSYSQVSKYCKNTNLFEKKLVFFPILSSSHWFLIVLETESCNLKVYDPYIKGSNATVLKSHHSEFLSKLEKEFLNPYCAINLSNTKSFKKEILFPPAIPEQQDGYNCEIGRAHV